MGRLKLNLGRGIKRIYIVFSIVCLCWTVYQGWYCIFGQTNGNAIKPFCPLGIGTAAQNSLILWLSVTLIWFVGKWIILGFKKDLDHQD